MVQFKYPEVDALYEAKRDVMIVGLGYRGWLSAIPLPVARRLIATKDSNIREKSKSKEAGEEEATEEGKDLSKRKKIKQNGGSPEHS